MLFTWTIDRHISARPYTSARAFAIIRRMHKLPVSLRHSFWGPPQFTARLRNIRAYVILSCMHECRVPNSEGPEMTMEECMCVVYFCKIFFHECRPTRRESGIRSLLTSNISRRTCFRTPLLIYQNASGPNFTFPKFVLGSYKCMTLSCACDCVNLLVQLAFSEWYCPQRSKLCSRMLQKGSS